MEICWCRYEETVKMDLKKCDIRVRTGFISDVLNCPPDYKWYWNSSVSYANFKITVSGGRQCYHLDSLVNGITTYVRPNNRFRILKTICVHLLSPDCRINHNIKGINKSFKTLTTFRYSYFVMTLINLKLYSRS